MMHAFRMMGDAALGPNLPCVCSIAPTSATRQTSGMYGSMIIRSRNPNADGGSACSSANSPSSPTIVMPHSTIAMTASITPANRRATSGSSRSSRA